jgi:hypothetical protein
MSVRDNNVSGTKGAQDESPNLGRAAKPVNLVSALLGDCLCVPFHSAPRCGLGPNAQFIELHGVEFIGLGAVVDELKPRERVRETVEQLTSRPERLVTIGYLLDDRISGGAAAQQLHIGGRASPTQRDGSMERMRITESIPLEIWNKNYPNDRSMARPLQQTIEHIKVRTTLLFGDSLRKLQQQLLPTSHSF